MNALIAWVTSPKTTAAVATGTTATGFGTMFDWIPSDIGRLAALVGIVLSCVLIFINVAAHLRNARRAELDIAKIRLELSQLQHLRATKPGRDPVDPTPPGRPRT